MTTVRSSRAGSGAAFVIAAAVSAALGARVTAHRLDEYLQAARIAIEPDRVQLELDLTPGIAVAKNVLADIDRDGNQSISDDEARAYSERALSAIALDVDGTPVLAELVDCVVPAIDPVLKGEGTTRIRAAAAMPRLAGGLHHLRYRNTFRSDVGVYLANALVPASDRVSVTSQRRDIDQRELLITFMLHVDLLTRLHRQLAVGSAVLIISCAFLYFLGCEDTLTRRKGRNSRCTQSVTPDGLS